MWKSVLSLAVLMLAACSRYPARTVIKPDTPLPQTVAVTVTEWRPVPTWAIEPVQVPPRQNDTVGEHLRHEHALEQATKLMNCHRRLLRRLNAGETPERKECEK